MLKIQSPGASYNNRGCFFHSALNRASDARAVLTFSTVHALSAAAVYSTWIGEEPAAGLLYLIDNSACSFRDDIYTSTGFPGTFSKLAPNIKTIFVTVKKCTYPDGIDSS